MKLLLLPGNSLRNKDWIHEVDAHLSDLFDTTSVHHYAHWQTGEEFINFDAELAAVCQVVAGFAPYAIFAKSVGSILSIRGIAEGTLTPHALLVTGLPLKVIKEKSLPVADWLQEFKIPVVIAQNDSDPIGSFTEVSDYISGIGNEHISVVELSGATHDYTDFTKLHEIAYEMVKAFEKSESKS